jgi:hypothetical protein
MDFVSFQPSVLILTAPADTIFSRLLVRHPAVMERLRREVKGVMGDMANPAREHVRKMPFLACVIKESLRLYPPVPLNNREAVKTTLLPTGGGPEHFWSGRRRLPSRAVGDRRA